MKIYILCPVRNVTDEQQAAIDSHAAALKAAGHEVHNPRYAVDQNCPTGYSICMGHLEAIREADEVHIFWDAQSYGSHTDLGSAMALDKRLKLIRAFSVDGPSKSYLKVIQEIQRRQELDEDLAAEGAFLSKLPVP